MAIVVGAMLVGAGLAALSGECLDLAIISFGCSQETTVENETLVEEKVVTTLLNQSEDVIQTTVTTNQRVKLRIFGADYVGNVYATQEVKGKIRFVADINTKTTKDLQEVLKTRVNEKIDGMTGAPAKFFEKQPNGITIEKVRTALLSSIDTSVTDENLSKIVFEVDNDQDVDILIVGKYVENLKITQNIALDIFARAVIEKVSATAMKNIVIQDLKKTLEAAGPEKKGMSATTIAGIILVIAIASYGAYYYYKKKKSGGLLSLVV